MAKNEMGPETGREPDAERRNFLQACGKLAVLTPPAVTFLLSTSMSSKAIAASGGTGGGGGGGGGIIGAVAAVGAEGAMIAGAPVRTKQVPQAQPAAPPPGSPAVTPNPPTVAPPPPPTPERG